MTNQSPIPNLSIIVAIAQNNAIGRDNDLIWHISEDLKRFKALTSGHAVIMGRNTWNSLPRRPLPRRRNIVLTHDACFSDDGAEVAYSVAQVLEMVKDEEVSFVMGGANVYSQFLPFARSLYVTWVWRDFEADVFFPTIDMSVFYKVSETEHFVDAESGLPYSYAEYQRRPQSLVFPNIME
ncbi:MAG: dihydrofolate reductase [Bacteroidales bacterium]|nr:dihydrofolate reductase [Bacteroidales bacterium]